MARPGRTGLIVGFLAAASLIAAGVALVLQTQERKMRLLAERQLFLVKSEKQQLEEQLRELTEAKDQLEADVVKLTEQADQIAQQLAEERQAKDTLAKSVDNRQLEIDRLGKDLAQARSERETLTTQITQLQTQQQELQQRLADTEKAKGELEAKVLELSGTPTVELDKIVVKSDEATSAPAASRAQGEGQVIVVNREYDFIVMDLGKKQGLQVGQEFQIMRGDEVLGRVKVEKVYEELSAAAILPESKKDSIREGDLVRAF